MNTEIAKILLDIEAVHLKPDDFFTWTSGTKSPIYCDNRQIISYPKYRRLVVDYFIDFINKNHPEVELIAGTATAGIPWASWISEQLGLPMIYIRSSSKGYGLKNCIEGKATSKQKTLIIEDLISTGKSSVAAANEAKAAGLEVINILSIFTYGFNKASQFIKDNDYTFHSLCELSSLVDYSLNQGLLTTDQVDIINKWKNSIENT